MTTASQNPTGGFAPGTTSQGGTGANGGDLKATASSLAEQAKNEGKQRVDSARQTSVEGIEKLAQSVRAAADELKQNDVANLSQYVTTMAESMTGLATRLRDKNPSDMATELMRVARENPALFVTGSIAVGFGLARFARATSQPQMSGGSDSQFSQGGSSFGGGSNLGSANAGSIGGSSTGSAGYGASASQSGMSAGTGGLSGASLGSDSERLSSGADATRGSSGIGSSSSHNGPQSGLASGSTGSGSLGSSGGLNAGGAGQNSSLTGSESSSSEYNRIGRGSEAGSGGSPSGSSASGISSVGSGSTGLNNYSGSTLTSGGSSLSSDDTIGGKGKRSSGEDLPTERGGASS